MVAGDGFELLRHHHAWNAATALHRVVDYLGLQKMPPQQAPLVTPGPKSIIAEYLYRDEDGNPRLGIERREADDGSKSFRQFSFDDDGRKIYRVKGIEQVPYCLETWKRLGHTQLWLCEGEKDADRLVGLGLRATTNAGGGLNWSDELTPYFSDYDVLILEDNDEVGRTRSEKLSRVLQPVASSVKVVRLANLPPKGDVSDWLDAGGTVEQLVGIAKATAPAQIIEPSPLPALLPRSPSFQPNCLPAPLRRWLTDIAERTQIPLEYVAVPALVALSSVVGRKIGIYPKQQDDWLVVPNLWGAIIGRPSTFKSPAISEATAPLRRLAKQALVEHEAALIGAETDGIMLKARKEGLQNQAKKAAKLGQDTTSLEADIRALLTEEATLKKNASERRYIVNDPTVEKLGELLNENPRGLLLVRDELSGLLQSFNKQGREGDREFYLEAWNGTAGFTVDRIGRGTLHIPSLTLSVIGGIQPAKLDPLIRSATTGSGGDDGLMQRLQLLVWPDKVNKWRNIDRAPDREAADRAAMIFEALDRLEPSAKFNLETVDGEIPALRLSPEAQIVADTWRTELEAKIRSHEMECAPAFESHLSKYRSLMPSLALIFDLVDAVDRLPRNSVSAAAVQMAIDWCALLEAHARKVYAAEVNRDLHAAHQLRDKIDAGEIEDGETVRTIYKHHWSGLDSREKVDAALAILERHNIVRRDMQATGGRPIEIIRLLDQAE